jgi:MFS family permease
MTRNISYLNVASYLGFCFLTIAFLVFLSSTQPFVLTEILSVRRGLGDKAGTLAFADELLAIVLCPLWGALSDKIGTRPIAFLGVFIIGLSLTIYTTASNVYPDLLALRLFFSVGGSACTAMITAMLTEMNSLDALNLNRRYSRRRESSTTRPHQYAYSPLFQSETDIPNALNNQHSVPTSEHKNSRLSGLVGMCTGFGAVAAVTILLPLPTKLGSLANAYYLVGTLAMVSSILLFFGLYRDRTKNLSSWIQGLPASISIFDEAALNLVSQDETKTPYIELIKQGFASSFEDRRIFVGYLGGFVARSSSVLNTLFIPLFVNTWFYNQGKCRLDIHDPASEIKQTCRDAYVQSAILTGISGTATLIFAPIWGMLGDYIGRNITIVLSALFGFIGSVGFAAIKNPHEPAAYVMPGFLGAGQIGAIVLSMSLCTDMKRFYSGAIAGVYSLYGGIGILVLSLFGGYVADANPGFPFAIMAVFYMLWFIATIFSERERIIDSLRFLGIQRRIRLTQNTAEEDN